ncbi:hypothetical protein Y59_44590 [Enterobacter hormaechei]|nr:hypothetical protein CSB67_1070 [Enterobacter hormaechei]KAF0677731.1 hypothetical protein Y59_44590 [Enterobacter hormaechei]
MTPVIHDDSFKNNIKSLPLKPNISLLVYFVFNSYKEIK